MKREKTEIPDSVARTYAELREKLSIQLSLKRIQGHYYLYKQRVEWDKERKRYICRESTYLGKIEQNGKFRAKMIHKPGDVDSAKAIIESHGGRVILPEEKREGFNVRGGLRISSTEKEILTALTMNARVHPMELAKPMRMSKRKLSYKISSLNKRLELQYIPHIRADKLGYSWSVILVRFLESHPDPAKLKEELDLIPNIQFCALTTNGKYDMMLFVVAENDEDLVTVLKNIKTVSSFNGLKVEWYVSYLFITKGFIPLRDKFFDLLEKKIWNRRMGSKVLMPQRLSKNEYMTLRAINRDGVSQFAEIERSIGTSSGSVRYTYDKLKSSGVVNIISANMPNLNILYNAVIVMELIDVSQFLPTRLELMKFINYEEEDFLTNRFSLVGDIGMPDGALLIMPVMKEGSLESAQAELAKKVNGIRISSFIITEILCGRLVYHRFDNTKSSQYNEIISSQ